MRRLLLGVSWIKMQGQSGSGRAGRELSPQDLCSGQLLVVSQEILMVIPRASLAPGPVHCQEESQEAPDKLSIGHVLSFQCTVTRGGVGYSRVPTGLGFVIIVDFGGFLILGFALYWSVIYYAHLVCFHSSMNPPTSLSLPSAGLTGETHHAWLWMLVP